MRGSNSQRVEGTDGFLKVRKLHSDCFDPSDATYFNSGYCNISRTTWKIVRHLLFLRFGCGNDCGAIFSRSPWLGQPQIPPYDFCIFFVVRDHLEGRETATTVYVQTANAFLPGDRTAAIKWPLTDKSDHTGLQQFQPADKVLRDTCIADRHERFTVALCATPD